jgi:hypothetical protein
LPPIRQTVWNPGLNAVGGIPDRTTIYKTLSPGGGDDTAAIQSALDSCPPDQVVLLTAGTFNISGQGLAITRSRVTLRGSGPTQTKLIKVSGTNYPVAIIGTRWYKWVQQTDLASDAVKGSLSVTLVDNPGLQVGEIVHVDETYDPALTAFDDSQDGDYQGWGEGRTGPKSDSRPIGQAMEIASISGNTVTFTTPFHIDLRTSRAAHLARIADGDVLRPAVTWSGIEDLYVAHGEGGDGGGNIRVFAAAYSWARNIESVYSKGASFAFDGAFRCELRDSYLHTTVNPTPGGDGYGIVVDSYSADNLVENNISWNFNKVMLMRSSGGGNVIGYNYMEDGYGSYYPTLPESGLNASHMTTPHHELFEGNESFNFDGDSRWGNSIYITAFRNHLTTLRRSVGYGTPEGVQVQLMDSANRRGISLSLNHWWYSFVGNVIGNPGMPTSGVEYEWTGPWTVNAYIWQLGYDSVTSHPDANVQATVLRDGNFDYVTNEVHWHNSAPLPLRASLYLTSKPAFFGANPWPWVDALGATKLAVLPARARFDELHP